MSTKVHIVRRYGSKTSIRIKNRENFKKFKNFHYLNKTYTAYRQYLVVSYLSSDIDGI